MKKYFVVALLAIMVLALGCAKENPVLPEASVPEVQQPTMTTPSTPTTTTSEVTEAAPGEHFVSAGTVEFLGAQGFSELKISVKVGDSITFVNKNPSSIDTWKNDVLVFQNEVTKRTVNSPQIPYGGTYVHTFNEAGKYQFWSVGYGVFGEVLVE